MIANGEWSLSLPKWGIPYFHTHIIRDTSLRPLEIRKTGVHFGFTLLQSNMATGHVYLWIVWNAWYRYVCWYMVYIYIWYIYICIHIYIYLYIYMIIYIYTYCSCMFYVHTYLHVYIHILSMYLQYVVSIYIYIVLYLIAQIHIVHLCMTYRIKWPHCNFTGMMVSKRNMFFFRLVTYYHLPWYTTSAIYILYMVPSSVFPFYLQAIGSIWGPASYLLGLCSISDYQPRIY